MILERFNHDHHESLLRQHFHIKQTSTVVDYVERYVALIMQLSSYNPKTDQCYITTRFVDGLHDSIRFIVLVQRLCDLDTACTLTLLQEEAQGLSRPKEYKKLESSSYTKPHSFHFGFSLPPPPVKPVAILDERRPTDNRRLSQHGAIVDEKLSTLRNYRKAQGLCMRYGDKWALGHRCAAQMQLQALQEVWNLCEPEFIEDDPPEAVEGATKDC